MTIDPATRKAIDKSVDVWISSAKLMKLGSTRLKKIWKFKNADDFIYGYAIGQLEGYAYGVYFGLTKKIPTSEETIEIKEIVEIRAKEIRKEIWSEGS